MQLLSAAIHAVSFFVHAEPANETEKQLDHLMSSYKMDMGQGFHTSMDHLFLALSTCFTMLYLLGGLINWYLVRKKAPVAVIKGILGINVIVFGASFVIMAFLTFLPPIACTGLVWIFCIIAYLTVKPAGAEKNAL